MAKRGGLGKGLDALFAENLTENAATVSVRLSQIEPNRAQPRKNFDPVALDELADSIRRYGLLQPLVVRALPDGRYQLVAGERRWRAARLAELTHVPVVVRELTDEETAEIALVENLQREDLNPVEEAGGYRVLMDDYGLTQEDLAAQLGRSRSAIANSLRLLALPAPILEMLKAGKITAGHARALLAFKDPDAQAAAAKAASFGATVRELERQAKKAEEGTHPAKKPAADPFYSEVELALQEALGRRVKVRRSGAKGTLEIEFYNKDDLKNIALKLE